MRASGGIMWGRPCRGQVAGAGSMQREERMRRAIKTGWVAASIVAAVSAEAAEPAAAGGHAFDLTTMLFVFMLATFIGLGVITRVSRLLHTPLMSLTNAISAIAVVGAIVITGADHPKAITILGAIALFASMTNIVSGFLITDRMLKMFKQERPRS
jgi:NAD(P) transhydrogenase subunit alpha